MNLTTRKIREYWTEVERVVRDSTGRAVAVSRTVCTCEAAGSTRRGCAIVAGNRTPCRCACHAALREKGA